MKTVVMLNCLSTMSKSQHLPGRLPRMMFEIFEF